MVKMTKFWFEKTMQVTRDKYAVELLMFVSILLVFELCGTESELIVKTLKISSVRIQFYFHTFISFVFDI